MRQDNNGVDVALVAPAAMTAPRRKQGAKQGRSLFAESSTALTPGNHLPGCGSDW